MAGVRALPTKSRLFWALVATTVVASTLLFAPRAFADDNVATDSLSMVCEVRAAYTPNTITQSGVPAAVPGESVTFVQSVDFDEGEVFQDILSRPDGSVYYASYLEHIVLESDLVLDPASAQLLVAPGASADPVAEGVARAVVVGTQPDPTDFVLETDTSVAGQTAYRLYFPGDEAQMIADQTGSGALSYTVPAGGEVFSLVFRAMVPTSSTAGEGLDGSECFSTVSTGPSNRDSSRSRTAVAVAVPELDVQKDTLIDNAYAPGGVAPYTLTVQVPTTDAATGQLTVAPARDVVLTDEVPTGLMPLDSVGAPVADGGTTGGGGVWSLADRTVTYSVGDILPGAAAIVIEEEMQVDGAVAPGTSLTNRLVGDLSYLPGDDVNDTVVEDADNDDAEIVVASNAPTVAKEALRIPDSELLADATPLERYGTDLPFWFAVTVTLPADSNYYNFSIFDTLPDGMVFNNYVSATCDVAAPDCPTATSLTPTVFAGGDTGIGWYPNVLPVHAGVRTYTLVYEVELDPTYFSGDALTFFDEFENDLRVSWNAVDRLGAVDPATAAPPTYDGEVDTSDTIIYDRPILTVDKKVTTSDGLNADVSRAAWDYEVGDIAVYTTVVTNVGSSDASNLTITDTPVGIDIDLSSVTVDGDPCATCTLNAGVLGLTIPGPITAAGGTVTVVYEAEPTKNGEIDNLFAIPKYEDPFGTPYFDNPSDSVPLEIPDPVLTIEKTAVETVPATANTVGTLYPFTIEVTNTGSVTAYNAVVTDVPPASVCNVFPNGIVDPANGPDGGLAANDDVTNTSSGVYALVDPLAPGATVSFDVWLEICGPITVGSYTNTANLVWEDLDDDVDEGGTAYSDTDDAELVLVEPDFTVSKFPNVDDGFTIPWSADGVDDNETLDGDPSDSATAGEYNSRLWTFTIKNTSLAPIGGLVLDDLMPDPFEYEYDLADPNYTVNWFNQSPSTITDNSTSGGGVLGADFTRQLDFTLGQLEPGGEVVLSVEFWHNGESPSDGDLTRYNEVTVTNDNLTFNPVTHADDGEYTLIPVEIGPSIEKTIAAVDVSPGVEQLEGAPGQQFDFTVDVIVPSSTDVEVYDIWVLDSLPDGLKLVNEPTANTIPDGTTDAGWNITCAPDATYTGTCPALTDADGSGNPGGQYLGTTAGVSGGVIDMAWFIGDQPTDPDEKDSRYRITFRVEVERTFSDDSEVIDGVDEPLINFAAPLFNRDPSLVGPTGNDETIPTSFPDPDDYDRLYPKNSASVDIVTPRLEVEKNVYDQDGNPITEVTAGEDYVYEIVVANAGSGAAYHIEIEDDLGSPDFTFMNFLSWSNVQVSPATASCSTVTEGTPPGGRTHEHLVCTEVGPLAPGAQMVITYDGTTVPNDLFFAQFSSQNFDPMFILNTAKANEYWESDASGTPAGNSYSTGEATSRVFAYTPVAEIDASCVGGAETLPDAPVGTNVQFWAVVGNGDRYDVNGNPDGDQTLTPYPSEDRDGDGYPDAGMGFNPEVRIAIQDKFTFNGVTATGPGAGDDTYTTYSTFAAPDQILDGDVDNDGDGKIDQAGTYILVWNTSLTDIPHSPSHASEGGFLPHTGNSATAGDFLPWFELLIDVTKTETGGGTIWFDLAFEDAAGNTDRGATHGEYWEFREFDRHGCPGGPPPRVWKNPDDTDGVSVDAGEQTWFTIRIQQPDETALAGTFEDLLPAGLTYAGDLDISDPDYAVAFMPVVPPGWTALEDYFVGSSNTGGDTLLEWATPPLPYGIFNDPLSNGDDTRWEIQIPVVADDDPLFPYEFVVNGFTWNPEGWGARKDTGAVLTNGFGVPSIDKRASTSTGLYGSTFEYTVDITIPADYAASDVVVYDQINRWRNWDTAPYLFQDDGTYQLGSRIFPIVPNGDARVGNAADLYNGPAHYFYDPAEFQLSDYVSDDCYSASCGSTGSPTDINAVPLPPVDLEKSLTTPLNYITSQETSDHNGAIGWYLGDITAHDTDRSISLVYEVDAPTLVEQMTRVAELRPASFPFGIYSDASNTTLNEYFTDPDAYWFQELSQVNHPNVVQLRSWRTPDGGDDVQAQWGNAADDAWASPGASNAWYDDAIGGNGTQLVVEEDDSVTVSYPLVQMDKQCNAIGATDESNPVYLNGSFNVECNITATNLSPVSAHQVVVDDQPLDDCRLAIIYGNGNPVSTAYATSWTSSARTADLSDPDVVTYPCPVTSSLVSSSNGTVTSGNNIPINQWQVDEIPPGRTETLTYQLAIDGWESLPNHPTWDDHGNYEAQGQWINQATLYPWSDRAVGGDTIGGESTAMDEVGFAESRISITKFPYPEGYNPCVHFGPFIDYAGADVDAINQWPYYYAVGASNYNPATATHVDGYGYPYGQLGGFWNDTLGNTCDDPLMPPERQIPWGTVHPFNIRGFALGAYLTGATSWTSFGDPIDDNGRGYWATRALDTPGVWNDIFDADPTEPYRWAIDVRVDGLANLSNMEIVDRLPYGWTYVPGSAEIIDGRWYLGDGPGSYITASGDTAGYTAVPLPDPAQSTIGAGSCTTDRNYHSNGETLTWNFQRDGSADGSWPWDYRYVDARDRYEYITHDQGWSMKGNWIRIHFDAIPTNGTVAGVPSVFDCDPDTTSSDDFFMENNVEVRTRPIRPILDQDPQLSDAYDMIAPVPNPIAFEKTPDTLFSPDESVQNFTVTFTNDLDIAVEDMVITDTLVATPPPGGSGPLPGGGYTCGTATATATAVGFTETNCVGGNSANTSLEWLIDSVAPGETIVITYPVTVPKDEQNLLVWDNTAATVIKEWFDTPFEDEGQITVVNPSEPPPVKKTATPDPATVNDVVTYNIAWAQAAQTVFMDLAYFDVVPDGLTFEGHIDVTCTGGCPAGYSVNDVITATPQVNPDGTTTLMWWFGDMPGSSTASTWTMRYTARVDDTYNDGTTPVVDEDALTNTVTGYSSHEDLLEDPTGLIDPSAWDVSEFEPSVSTHVLAVEEPELAISKSATPDSSPVDSSSTITFTVEVENVGGMDAYAVDIRDLPNGALENLVMDPTTYSGSVVTQGWTSVAPEVGWFIPLLERGDTATFTYTAEVTDDFLIDGFGYAENNANVEAFRARGGVDPEEGDRTYEGDEASVQVTLSGPEIDVDKHAGNCTDEFSPATVGESTTWCIDVINNGDSTAYGALVGDTLPFHWTYDTGSTTGSGWSASEPTLTNPFTDIEHVEWNLGDLAPGVPVQIEFTATAGPDSPLNVTNWVIVDTFTSDGDPLPATVTGARDRDPASAGLGTHFLEIAKTADEQEWGHIPDGGTVDWTITITNPHPSTDNTDLVVTDYLPAPLAYDSWASTDSRVSLDTVGTFGGGAGGTQEVTWDITDLAAGESIDIVLTADVPGTVLQLEWYVNDAEVTSAEVTDQVVNQAKVRFFEPASIGDFTWLDADGDGIQDSDEDGLDGATVNLLDGDGNQLYRDPATGLMTTDAGLGWPAMTVVTGDDPSTPGVEQGWYSFDGLPSGSYQVEFVAPSGYGLTVDNVGGNDAEDSDADRLTGLSQVVWLDWGDDEPTLDAGFVDEKTYWTDLADIDIEKDTNGVQADTAPGPTVAAGEEVTWTYEVENTGWVALSTVVIEDDDPAVKVSCDFEGDGKYDDGNKLELMLPGDTVSCQATGSADSGSYSNNSTVTGDPVLPNPDKCDCDLGDPSTWPTDSGTYEDVTIDGKTPLGPETDEDPSHYYGFKGSLDVEKYTNGVQADDPTGPAIPTDDRVIWTYVVTNNSTTAISDAKVTDSRGETVECDIDGDGDYADDATNVIPLLLPKQSMICQATGASAAGPYDNTASVEGNPVLPDPATCKCDINDPSSWPNEPDVYDPAVDGNGDKLRPLTDSDPSHYYGSNTSVDIEKFTNGVQADVSPGPTVSAGDKVTWTYQVTNTGNVALIKVSVADSDPTISISCEAHLADRGGDDVIGVLLPGDVVTCTATAEADSGQYKNESTVKGHPFLPDPDSCKCELDDPSTWPEDTDGYGPAMTPVIDPKTGLPVIDPKTGEAVSEPQEAVTDSDPSHYYGFKGSLDVEKLTNSVQADDPTGPALTTGDDVVWTYVVTNNSTTAIADAKVTDSRGETVECDIDGDGDYADDATDVVPLLLPERSVTCQATGRSIAGPYDNTASVEGNPVLPNPDTCKCDLDDPSSWPDDPALFDPALDAEGEKLRPITDSDPSHYYGSEVSVDIEKFTNGVQADVAPGPTVSAGDKVTWTYQVTNTGNVALIKAIVADSDPTITVSCEAHLSDPGGDDVIGVLLPGDVVTCTATGEADSGPYTNDSTVKGSPFLPDPDSCKCKLDDPSTWPEGTDGYEPAMTPVINPKTGLPVIDSKTGEAVLESVEAVTDSDPSHYFGFKGSLDVEKYTNGLQADDPTGPAIPTGDRVIWTYVVTNNSTTAIADAKVTDSEGETADCDIDGDGDFADDASNVIPLLIPGQSVICQATGTSVDGPYGNTGSVSGDPILPDPATCKCELDDPSSWPDDPELYDPALDDEGEELDPISDDDRSHYFGTDSSIDIEKFTNLVQADIGPGPGIPVGDTVTWTYQVTNRGNVAMLGALVADTDPSITVSCEAHLSDPGGDNVIALLRPDDVVTCTATGESSSGQYNNDSTVEGTPYLPDLSTCDCEIDDPSTWPEDTDGYERALTPVINPDTGLPVIDPKTGEAVSQAQEPVTDSDPSHYFGTDGGIDVEKDTNGVQADVGPGPAVDVDAPVTWTYEVANTSSTALANVTVTDNQGVVVDCDIDGDGSYDGTNVVALMLPDAKVTCQGTGVAVVGQYENAGVVTGDPILPDPELCDCDPDDPTTWPEDPTLYDPALSPGGDPLPPVVDTDISHYFGSTGGVDIEKSTNGRDADTGSGPIIPSGETVRWSYVVTNTSSAALADVTVTDDKGVAVDCGGSSNVISLLLPGASVTCTGTGEAERGLYENIGSVTGDPVLPDPESCGCTPGDPATWPTDPQFYDEARGADGNPLPPVDNEDRSAYEGREVDLAINKTVVTSTVTEDEAAWLVDVENNGPDSAPGPIEVVDNLPTELIYVSAEGLGWTCSASGQTVSCSYAGGLAVDEQAPPLTISTRIDAAPGTAIENEVTVTAPALNEAVVDPDSDPDSDPGTGAVSGSTATGAGETATENNTDSDSITTAEESALPGALAFTGGSFWRLVLIATALVAAGIALMTFSGLRRRQS